MLRHTQGCAEEEARRVLQKDDRSLSLNNLDAFISIIYARGVYGATKLKLHELWNRLWGPLFFAETMSRNRFVETIKVLGFDFKQIHRSHQLASDKFALVSILWHSFIRNCVQNYKPGASITITKQLFTRQDADLRSTFSTNSINLAQVLC